MKKIFSFLVFATASLGVTASAFSVPLDYDSDSRSNFSSVKINSDNSLTWVYKSVSEDTVDDLPAFGVAGNHLMPGFYSDSETVPGVVTKKGIWRFANGVKRKFGSADDLFIGGADFDGDSLSDIAYTTNACVQRKSTFKTILNPTASSTESAEIPVGAGNQYKFYYDSNNDGRDDICFLKPMKRSRQFTGAFRAICKSALTGNRIKAIRLGKVFAQPQVLRTKDGGDFILLTTPRARKTRIKLLSSSGQRIISHTFNESGTVVVGNFSTDLIEEIALVKNSSALLLNPLTGSEQLINYPAGVPYDLNNIEHFSTDKNCFCTSKIIRKHGRCRVTSNPDNGGGGDNGGGDSEIFIPDNCSNPPEHITSNDGFKCIGSDTRGGSVVCLLPYQFTWAPHKSVTDHHNYTFACNANDDHFSKVELVLNSGQRIGLSYSGCHNYVATPGGAVGRQHFRNESIKWSNIQNSVRTIEMTRGGSKTCLRF